VRKIKRKSYGVVVIAMILILVVGIAIASTTGSANISPFDVFRIVYSHIPHFGKTVDISDISSASKSIIWNVRLPRVLLGVLVGTSLSVAGGAFQGLLKNPMADPFILGISSGAALGATIAIIFRLDMTFMGFSGISVAAFIGALIAVFAVYNIGKVKNKVPVTTLLLAGVAVGNFLTAVMSFLMVVYSRDMTKIIYWTLGNLSGKGWEPVKMIFVPVLIGVIVILYLSKDINIMLTGEESAKSLGVNVERTKIYVLLAGTFLTSIVVSVSGIIGFVGLIIPHIIRLFTGPDHRILLPVSALAGAVFMIFADTVARVVISPVEIPVGIITALFGGPFFVFLLKRKKKSL
jgi:iron complex transport system permease protein